MSGEEKAVRPESRGGRVEVRPGPLSEELRKPLIFGNHQRHFKVFTAAVTAALTYYLVFHHDFGPHRHVFSWIRELKERKKREFFHIDPEDDELRRVREQATATQQSNSDTATKDAR